MKAQEMHSTTRICKTAIEALSVLENVLGENDPQPVIGEGQLAADIPFVAIAENVAQPIRLDIQRPMQVVRAAGATWQTARCGAP